MSACQRTSAHCKLSPEQRAGTSGPRRESGATCGAASSRHQPPSWCQLRCRGHRRSPMCEAAADERRRKAWRHPARGSTTSTESRSPTQVCRHALVGCSWHSRTVLGAIPIIVTVAAGLGQSIHSKFQQTRRLCGVVPVSVEPLRIAPSKLAPQSLPLQRCCNDTAAPSRASLGSRADAPDRRRPSRAPRTTAAPA